MTRYGTLVVVDDDADVLTAARLLLKPSFRRVVTLQDPQDLDAVMHANPVDVYLLDMNFALGENSGAEGLDWLRKIREQDSNAVVVLMTAFGDLNTAVEAMRLGAADFVLKPWQNDKLVATLSVAAELRRSRETVSALGVPASAPNLVAESAAMRAVLHRVSRVAPTDATVLIRGENGTGKELIAHAIHQQSKRASQPMVAVDLGAVAESLFESELFGHTKGAFTDATSSRAGRFQAASSGTLFLDEIGNLPSPLQTKLLRVLESREVVPVGTDQPIAIDVRLVAATNRSLETMVSDGLFREDLLFRINTIEIVLPPLRDRADDLEPLATHFVTLFARKHGVAEKAIAASALAAMRSYRWPGNVRELAHTVERALILGEQDELHIEDLGLRQNLSPESVDGLNLEANERRLVALALRRANGNVSQAAAILGITRAALYRRKEKFGL